MDWGPRVTYLAATSFKDRTTPFGIKDLDRQQHVCVLGKVGSGRGNLLSRMALQDIERSLGTLILDASGNLAPVIMERLTKEQLSRLVYLDAADAEYPFSWNIPNEFRHSPKGEELWLDAFASVYNIPRGPLSEFLARWVLADPSRTLLSPYYALAQDSEKAIQFPPESESGATLAQLVATHTDVVADFLENGRYLAKDTMVRNMVGQRDGKFTLRSLTEGSICIVDLSRIRVFPTRVQPLVRLFSYAFRAQMGSSTATAYFHDVLRYLRAEDARALLGDHSFALTLSDTVYRESDMPLREQALSQCGSVVTFEPHHSDIPLVQKLFYPYVTPEELQGLEPGEACVLLTIDSARSRPFFANALDLPERTQVSLQDIIVDARKKFTTPRMQVDDALRKQPDEPPKSDGGGTKPPFNDAFKNIFAKRDPANFLAPSAALEKEKKAEQSPQKQDVKVETPAPAPAPQHAPAPEPKAGAEPRAPEPKEVSEDELRALMSVALPA